MARFLAWEVATARHAWMAGMPSAGPAFALFVHQERGQRAWWARVMSVGQALGVFMGYTMHAQPTLVILLQFDLHNLIAPAMLGSLGWEAGIHQL